MSVIELDFRIKVYPARVALKDNFCEQTGRNLGLTGTYKAYSSIKPEICFVQLDGEPDTDLVKVHFEDLKFA